LRLAYNDFGGDVLESFEDEKSVSLRLFVNLGHVLQFEKGGRGSSSNGGVSRRDRETIEDSMTTVNFAL
jgi:hypothetical protein